MKLKSPSQLRLISGIRTPRAEAPMVQRQRAIAQPETPQSEIANIPPPPAPEPIHPAYEEEVELPVAPRPETTAVSFKAIPYDKDYSFNYIQARWFRRKLYLGEKITITADELKMMCDETHEMGRLRERNLNKYK